MLGLLVEFLCFHERLHDFSIVKAIQVLRINDRNMGSREQSGMSSYLSMALKPCHECE